MNARPIDQVVTDMLAERGKTIAIAAHEPIFTSGLLDSLAATELMMTLETEYGIDLADADFDISQLDTVSDLQNLIAANA